MCHVRQTFISQYINGVWPHRAAIRAITSLVVLQNTSTEAQWRGDGWISGTLLYKLIKYSTGIAVTF